MIDQKRERIMTALGNLLESCGKEVRREGFLGVPSAMESVAEPLSHAKPEELVTGFVLHAGDAVCACEQLVKLAAQLNQFLCVGQCRFVGDCG